MRRGILSGGLERLREEGGLGRAVEIEQLTALGGIIGSRVSRWTRFCKLPGGENVEDVKGSFCVPPRFDARFPCAKRGAVGVESGGETCCQKLYKLGNFFLQGQARMRLDV